MSALDAIGDILQSLRPVHEAMRRFEQGGPGCAKFIERLYTRLNELELAVRYDATEREGE